MERVGMAWAPLVRGAKIDARTTQSPANRGASPKCARGDRVHRRTSIAMRTMRWKSTRFCARARLFHSRFQAVKSDACKVYALVRILFAQPGSGVSDVNFPQNGKAPT